MQVKTRHLILAAIVMVLLAAIVFGTILMYRMDDRRTQRQKGRQQIIGAALVVASILASIPVYVWWTWARMSDL